MFDGLFELIPPAAAVGILVLLVCIQFAWGIGKMIYAYFTQKHEDEKLQQIENKIDRAATEGFETNTQVKIILAHYESEQRFRQELERRVHELESKINGNGKPSLSAQLDVVISELHTVKQEVEKLRAKMDKK